MHRIILLRELSQEGKVQQINILQPSTSPKTLPPLIALMLGMKDIDTRFIQNLRKLLIPFGAPTFWACPMCKGRSISGGIECICDVVLWYPLESYQLSFRLLSVLKGAFVVCPFKCFQRNSFLYTLVSFPFF